MADDYYSGVELVQGAIIKADKARIRKLEADIQELTCGDPRKVVHIADPEVDLFSDAMDRAIQDHHSVRHGAMRNAERSGEYIDPEMVARRAMAAGITAYLQELGFTLQREVKP
jgi:hypothetical protein